MTPFADMINYTTFENGTIGISGLVRVVAKIADYQFFWKISNTHENFPRAKKKVSFSPLLYTFFFLKQLYIVIEAEA